MRALFLVLLSCLALLTGCRKEETHEEKRAKKWKKDYEACETFAAKRYEARRLLASDPEAGLNKNPLEKLRESGFTSRRFLDNFGADMKLWNEDRRTCLRGQGWKDEQIDELEEKDRKQNR